METIKVYSTIEDKNIRKNLNESPIWKKAIHADDLNSVQDKYKTLWEYEIKFEGLIPVQVTNVKRYK
jgi:hypothetical protein